MSSTTKNPTRGYMILALDFLLFLALIKMLPFTPMENRGLALLIFIGILWLTEAFNITVTSLMVPILAIGLNVLPTKAILASQLKITFSEWLFYGIPVAILLMIGMVFSLLVVLRPNFNVPFEISLEGIPLTSKRKITLAVFVIAAFFLVFGSWLEPFIRSVLELSQPIKNFDAVVAMTAVIILCITHTATWSEIQDRTEWGVLMLFGGGLVLGIVLKETGASKILADTIVNYIGMQHWLVMTLVLTAFIVFLTEFTSNTATAALMTPIFISVAEGLGLPPVSLAAIVACSASCAFMLPIATPPNAIVFSTGYIKQSEMVKVGFILNIISTVVIGGLTYFFWINWH